MPNGTPQYQLNLPEWNDVIHVVPERTLPAAERRARRRARAARIAASPAPQLARDVQGFLTAWDDIQDGLVTLALLSRAAVRFYPPAERIARWAAVGADVMNAPVAHVTGRVMSKSAKRDLVQKYRGLPTTYQRRLRETVRTGKWSPRVTEWLQVAQTTDTLFGVGVQLGAAMAFPVEAAALSLTGGTLTLPFAGPEVDRARDFLGPWEDNLTLRTVPAVRARVERAKRDITTRRADEIKILRALPHPTLEQQHLLEVLEGLGADVSAPELAARLKEDGQLEMLPLFGIPTLQRAFWPELTERPPVPIAEVLREKLVARERVIEQQPQIIAARAQQEMLRQFGNYAALATSTVLQKATQILNAWKRLAPAKDDLTDQEHVDALLALYYAHQVATPLFMLAGYDLPHGAAGDEIDAGGATTDALNTWGDRIHDADLRAFAQSLLSEVVPLQLRGLEPARVEIQESLPPLAAATVKLTEGGAYSDLSDVLEGSRIDPGSLKAIIGPDIWQDLTEGERRQVLDYFTHQPRSPL